MSYERNKIISLIYCIFQAEDYRWGLEGKRPTYEEIEQCVSGLEESAYKVKGFAETGRINVLYDKETRLYDYHLSLGCSSGG